jgi:hypothetical protein
MTNGSRKKNIPTPKTNPTDPVNQEQNNSFIVNFT